ncbi:hypothetical protein HPB47_018411 [Ixodes persulcatus]|uniref:Uncharacterized protein n=1 Tax=Ixodes persulcatus TaxID=34615 RepID=A0AC60QKY7_IXOPE|nr:hypothetical protein HPB47_018411 [Ixodes persulcatus]
MGVPRHLGWNYDWPTPPPIVEPVVKPDGEIDVFFPVTAKELREARLPLNSAPGPDSFTAPLLRAVPPTILRVLLNLLMLLGRVPAEFQAGRTVFISKSKPAMEAGHFRPITVAPVIQRLLHKLLARRLTAAVGLNFRQRAFNLWAGARRVSTEANVGGAVQAGLADNFVSYARDLYRASQSILSYEGESLLVEPTTGVRQRDRLSPTIFNLVLDEYLATTDTNFGITSGEFRLDVMALTDHLLVFAPPGRGRRRGGVNQDFRELLQKITRAPLKPQQRFFILRDFLLPRLHHRLVLGLWGIGTLSKLDRMSRATIRKWLALPHDTTVGYFHIPVSEGGLGVTSLRTAVPGMTLARIKGLRFSVYPGCEAALRCRMLLDQVRCTQQPVSLNGIPLTIKAEVRKYWAGRLHGSYDGAALRDTRHVPAAQPWISNGNRLLPGRHYVNVTKLRVNALPNLSRTKRGRTDDVSCRAGCSARESLGHVL